MAQTGTNTHVRFTLLPVCLCLHAVHETILELWGNPHTDSPIGPPPFIKSRATGTLSLPASRIAVWRASSASFLPSLSPPSVHSVRALVAGASPSKRWSLAFKASPTPCRPSRARIGMLGAQRTVGRAQTLLPGLAAPLTPRRPGLWRRHTTTMARFSSNQPSRPVPTLIVSSCRAH